MYSSFQSCQRSTLLEMKHEPVPEPEPEPEPKPEPKPEREPEP